MVGKKEMKMTAQKTLVSSCKFPGSAAARTFREPPLPLSDSRLAVDDGPASRKSCFDRSRNMKGVGRDAVSGIPLEKKWKIVNDSFLKYGHISPIKQSRE